MFSKHVVLRPFCGLAILLWFTSASWGASNFFQPVQSYASGGWRAVAVAMADVNGDGKVDLLAANQCVMDDNCTVESGGLGRGAVGVLLGNGDGTFQLVHTYLSGGYSATSIVAADVNGDGKVDLVVGHECGDSDCSGRTVVGVLLGNGDGTFQPAATYGSGGYGVSSYSGPASIAVADLNRDGKADIVVANGLVQKARFDKGDALVGVLLGNGDGTFQPAQMYNSGDAISAISVALADLNRDGKLDLVVGHGDENFHGGSTIGVLLGNGDGTFQTAQAFSSGGKYANSIVLKDMNGDGKIDLLVTNVGDRLQSSPTVLRLGDGNGAFAAAQRVSAGGLSIVAADVNWDGKPDFLELGSLGVKAWLGDGDGTFQLPRTRDKSDTWSLIAVADVNGDGRPDVAVALGCINFDDYKVWECS